MQSFQESDFDVKNFGFMISGYIWGLDGFSIDVASYIVNNKIPYEMYIMIPNPSPDPVPRGGAGAQQFLLARRAWRQRRGKFRGLRRATGSVVVGASAPGLGRCHLRAARQRGTDALATGSRWIRWIGQVVNMAMSSLEKDIFEKLGTVAVGTDLLECCSQMSH